MFRLVLGPMKSGKSFALISRFAPLAFSDKTFMLFQPAKNTRDAKIESRLGLQLPAKKITQLADILLERSLPQVIGIDEIHLFDGSDVGAISQILKKGHEVYIVGCNLDYRGKMFDIVKQLLELSPDEVIHQKAVCELCQSTEGIYTQVWYKGKIMTNGLPPVIVEDGTYVYKPVCRQCFQQEKEKVRESKLY